METALHTLTDFGDLAVLFPLAVILAVWLTAMRSFRAAAAWIVALGFCMGATGIAKVYTFVCPTLAELHSPSGHTSLSTLVYGGIAIVLACESQSRQRALSIIVGVFFVIGIAISRILVDAHTMIEVIVGLGIGLAALAFFSYQYLHYRPDHARLIPLIATAAMLMILLNGQQVHAEDFLQGIAAYFRQNIQAACI